MRMSCSVMSRRVTAAEVEVTGFTRWGLTFDMSGSRRQAKPAGGCPLDGGVRSHVGMLPAFLTYKRSVGDRLTPASSLEFAKRNPIRRKSATEFEFSTSTVALKSEVWWTEAR